VAAAERAAGGVPRDRSGRVVRARGGTASPQAHASPIRRSPCRRGAGQC